MRQYTKRQFLSLAEHILGFKEWEKIQFVDAHLSSGEEVVSKYLDGLIELGSDTPFFCQLRPRRITESFANLLAKAGCDEVGTGLESGDDSVLVEMQKSSSSRLLKEMATILGKNGIDVTYYMIVGFPTERLKSVAATMRLLRDLNRVARISVLADFYFVGYVQSISLTSSQKWGVEVNPILDGLKNGYNMLWSLPGLSFTVSYSEGMSRLQTNTTLGKYRECVKDLGIESSIPPPYDAS